MKARNKPLVAVAAAAGLALLGLALWLAFLSHNEPDHEGLTAPSTLLARASRAWDAGGNPFSADSSARATSQPVEAPKAPSLADSSLAGTSADGAWPTDGLSASGELRPTRELRRRFDYYLSLAGEQEPASISALLASSANAELKPALAQAVIALWQRYLSLQQHTWTQAINPRDPQTYAAALAERRQVRRERLGAAAAYAFYADEEREFEQAMVQAQAGKTPGAQAATAAQPEPPSQGAVAALPDATQRLALLQAEWAAWDARISQARAEIAELNNAAHLSAPQRKEATALVLSSRFEAHERARAAALLQL